MPRTLKYVPYNEDPNPTQGFRPGNFEYMHYDAIFDLSRPATRVRTEDMPEEFFELIAHDMLSGQNDEEELSVAGLQVSPQLFAQGSPLGEQ